MVSHMSIRRVTVYAVIAVPTIFLFDLLRPLGVAGAMPYVTLPLLGLLARTPRAVVSLATLGTVLTVAGTLLSTGGAPLPVVLINRGMSVALIWIVAAMALRHLAIGDVLRASLEREASCDPLTELYNRRYVFGVIENELKRFRRYGDRFSLILIDADYFKRVNDTLGHDAGDAALRYIASVCVQSVRETDVVGRFGGEEFLIVLPHTDKTEAAVVAERIRQAMHQRKFEWQRRAVTITLSLGVAEASAGAASFDELLKVVDQALYAAKRNGRDRIAVADGSSYPVTKPRAA